MSEQLHVEVVENGFIACEASGSGQKDKRHVFTNASELGDFIAEWGAENKKTPPPRPMAHVPIRD